MKLILGTMTFGPQVDTEDGLSMLRHFHEAGYTEVDTAFVYNEGTTEEILGTVLKKYPDSHFSIATKVHPRITGRLDSKAVTMQFNESLRRLNKDRVDILYLHFPDLNTPIEEALSTCADLYKDGKIKEVGLSNFPAKMVSDICMICEKKEWPLPKVYQGRYNALSRNVENELLPVLRDLNIRFYAYNPLAGGLLTGKHNNFYDNPIPGRFSRLQSYRDRYWKKSFFKAVDVLKESCKKEEIPMVEAAIRWLVHHSFLEDNKDDGIIIGASKIEQLIQNILAVGKKPLPNSILKAFNIAWEEAKQESPEYYKFYS